jgi:hypothetical protein
MQLREFIKYTIREKLNEGVITIPNIPNTRNFFHGGNLDDYNDVIAQKNGRYEYGPGLYLITRYDIAKRYAKGSRKLYIISVESGNDISDAYIDNGIILEFINTYVTKNKIKEINQRISKYINENNQIPADVFNNTILNSNAIKGTNTKYLRQFLIDNNIDYEMVNNTFGFGEDMMVLYNMKKIKNIIQVKSTDRLDSYEL